ncbi:MAG: c-type cytochrome [Betaproteobacteria bacterium]|nr:c-type cytochrome [Betaproteobacteria bacterium]
MSRFTDLLLALTLCAAGGAGAQADRYPGIGRAATPAEIRAWDIDVRPDFKGLPAGSGSVAKGQVIWDEKCASCHGTFGESNEVFSPLVGGTTAEDIKSGRVKALQEPMARTTLMKVSSISTLWDYINRAMPWNAPKTLAVDEVYAVLAYLLNLGDIVPADFVLSEKTMQQVQDRLPNRNGKVKYDGLWSIRGSADVRNVACMKDCKLESGLASALPDFARGTHGNLADQQRLIGPARGVDTAKAPVSAAKPVSRSMSELATKNNCSACHQLDKKLVGPSYKDIAARYKADDTAESKLVDKVKKGGGGVWGPIPMPPNALKDEDIRALVHWILAGAPE